jgi:hypothetical protein
MSETFMRHAAPACMQNSVHIKITAYTKCTCVGTRHPSGTSPVNPYPQQHCPTTYKPHILTPRQLGTIRTTLPRPSNLKIEHALCAHPATTKPLLQRELAKRCWH